MDSGKTRSAACCHGSSLDERRVLSDKTISYGTSTQLRFHRLRWTQIRLLAPWTQLSSSVTSASLISDKDSVRGRIIQCSFTMGKIRWHRHYRFVLCVCVRHGPGMGGGRPATFWFCACAFLPPGSALSAVRSLLLLARPRSPHHSQHGPVRC